VNGGFRGPRDCLYKGTPTSGMLIGLCWIRIKKMANVCE